MFTEELHEKVKGINQKNRERQGNVTSADAQTELVKKIIKNECYEIANRRRIGIESSTMTLDELDNYIKETLEEQIKKVDEMSHTEFLKYQITDLMNMLGELFD